MNLPSKATLKKYGLSQEEWQALYYRHNGCCYICGKSFEGHKACVDHYHVTGFKKMAKEDKRKYIRGMLCFPCNRLLVQRSNSLEKLKAAVKYLETYELRHISNSK